RRLLRYRRIRLWSAPLAGADGLDQPRAFERASFGPDAGGDEAFGRGGGFHPGDRPPHLRRARPRPGRPGQTLPVLRNPLPAGSLLPLPESRYLVRIPGPHGTRLRAFGLRGRSPDREFRGDGAG